MKRENSDEVYNGATGEKGELVFDSLYPGKYVLTEKKTKEEYNINETPFNVNVEYNKQSDITVENDLKRGSLKIIKQDSENSKIKLSRR